MGNEDIAGASKKCRDTGGALCISNDEVVWIMDIFDRLIETNKLTLAGGSISQKKGASKIAAFVELCEILNIEFKNKNTIDNVFAEMTNQLRLNKEGDK